MIERIRRLSIRSVYQTLRRGIHVGYCPICEKSTLFFKKKDWWRDHYHCIRCLSVPRQRALVHVLQEHIQNWRDLNIHESSPSGPTYEKLSTECLNYIPTQFYPEITPGSKHQGYRCEDLAKQTFDDESFDVVITQDVLEHLLDPIQSLKEMHRTLKPGGVHLFTVPWYSWQDTKIRAKKVNGEIEYLEQPDYHSNPVDDKGSLVVTEWGKDLIDTIYASTKMSTIVIQIRDKRMGIEAKFIEVFLSTKCALNADQLTSRWR